MTMPTTSNSDRRTARRITLAGIAASLVFTAFAMPSRTMAQAVSRDASIIAADVGSRVEAFLYEANSTSRLTFKGSSLAPRASGTATVRAAATGTEIDAEFKGLPEPQTLGPYTVYALWAITPEGRANLVGALERRSSGNGKLEATSPLTGYALIVTAEPHFLVSIPSTRVVLENVAKEFKGRTQAVTTLADRADYSTLTAQRPEKRKPLIVDQARYAVAIAQAAGAETLSPDAYRTASDALVAAESAWKSRKSSERRRAPELGRLAVQAGADARASALRRGEEVKRAEAEQAALRAAEATRLEAANAAAQAQLASAANQRAGSAEQRAAEMRADLLKRMNAVLPTRDTARGLVVEIEGVQFATGKAILSSAARESLARLAGAMSAFPDLDIKVEGHTDSTGSEATNRQLSLQRALSVRDYLVSQSVPASIINADGLASAMPVGDNATAEGRARNRRVEIIVSGEGITPRR